MLLEADKGQRMRLFGEDSCELVSTIEQAFGIKFSEDDLVKATTIGILAHTVVAKLEHRVSTHCLTAVTFYKLRRAFVELFDFARAEIAPTTSLCELMPWKDRKKQWRKVQDHLNYVLPQLTWPTWLLALWLLLTGLVLYLLFGWKLLRTLGAASALVGIIGFISISVLVAVILSPLGRNFPRSCETFGGLVKLALARNYGRVAARHGMSSEEEVNQSLLQLIAAETASDVEKISSDTHFPEGLHIY